MYDISPNLTNIRSLNLFEQPMIKEQTLIRMISLNPNLQSLCVNALEISQLLLAQLIDGPIMLKRLSIYGCSLPKEDLEWFLQQLKSTNTEMVVYTSIDELQNEALIQKSDNWFMQENLDIFSLWQMATDAST